MKMKKSKFVWRVVYGKDKPYYFLDKKKEYVKNKLAIKVFGNSRQIKILTSNLSAREF